MFYDRFELATINLVFEFDEKRASGRTSRTPPRWIAASIWKMQQSELVNFYDKRSQKESPSPGYLTWRRAHFEFYPLEFHLDRPLEYPGTMRSRYLPEARLRGEI